MVIGKWLEKMVYAQYEETRIKHESFVGKSYRKTERKERVAPDIVSYGSSNNIPESRLILVSSY